MWRSLMARSQFLVSHLRLPTVSTIGDVVVVAANRKLIHSPRAYASDTTSVPDLVGTAAPPKCNDGSAERTSAASSNRHRQGCCCCCCCGRRPRRHLYVVLDEINTGHSLYKFDVDDLDGGDEDAVARWNMDKAPPPPPPPQRLPEAALRLGVSLVGSGPRFEAMGNKIVIMGVSRTVDIYKKKNDDDDFDHDDGHSGDNDHGDDTMITLVYNTETAKLDIGRPTLERLASRYIATSAGDKMYMLVSDEPPLYLGEESVMPNLLRCGSHGSYESSLSSLRGQMNEWAWKRSPTPLPLVAGAGGQRVISYAVHPDGRTIFATASSSLASPSFTFSFDSSKGGEPTRHHDWCLPFHGRAYYDGDLDAWVGIRNGDDTDGRTRGRHYLCSCDVPDLGNDPATPLSEPAWKMCEEELTFLDEPEYEYLDGAITSPTLVHTGRGRFCLVKVMLAPSGSHCTCLQDGGEHLLHLTMFRAKHGKDGKLVVAPCRPGRSYLIPSYCYNRLGPPPAFWM